MITPQRTPIVKYTAKILREMQAHAHGDTTNVSILLSGDPGIGKTTYIGMLCELLGLKAIIIEVPHITEEHLINIPFLVFNGMTGSSTASAQKVTTGPDYKLILADSNLFTQLHNVQKIPDAQYLEHMKKAPKHIQNIYVSLGGNETKIPDSIESIRNSFNVVLFFDEALRKTSVRIRNCLRDILNGNIGNHIIPKSAYVIFASNTRDPSGLDVIPENYEFQEIEHMKPTKDNWFMWLESKFEHDKHITLNTTILNKFKKILIDSDISHNDAAADVRTSPRRWEQLLLYINSSLPAKDEQHARALLTNIKNNFINYDTGNYAALHDKVVEAVSELIKSTSNILINKKDTSPEGDWRDSLNHMVEQQMKLGDHRRHIPTISGPPGIGKTTYVQDVAAEHNMLLVNIDTSSLNADDVIGIPFSGARSDDDSKIEVQFSIPKLHEQITQKIKQKLSAYEKVLTNKEGVASAKQAITEFNKQDWKYLIFFDEVNATNDRVFNALRRVLLEKNFGASGDNSGKVLELPKGSMVIAAMNPHRQGTEKLTGHFKDIADIIPAGANWDSTKKYLEGKKYKGVSEDINHISFGFLTKFINKFKTDDKKYDGSANEFFLQLSQAQDPVYVTPREYTTMYGRMCREIAGELPEIKKQPDIKPAEMRTEMDDVVLSAFKDSLNFVFTKKEVFEERDDFFEKLGTWIHSLPDTVYGALLVKSIKTDSLVTRLEDYFTGTKSILKLPNDEQLVNSHNNMSNEQIISELKTLLTKVVVDEDSVKKYILDESHKKIERHGDNLKQGSDDTSMLTNFVLGYIFTLHLHEYSNDRLNLIVRALPSLYNSVLSKLAEQGKIDDNTKDDAHPALMAIAADAHELISGL